MDVNESHAPNILNLEKKFQEMVYEHQRNTETLDKLQREHLQVRQELYSKELTLQSEQRTSHELRYRFNAALERMNQLEEAKTREQIDHSNLQLDFECVIRERDSLSREAISGRMEAAKLKLELASQENELRRKSRREKELEQALIELKTNYEKITANLDAYIDKFTKEHNNLRESCKSTITLNKRLQTVGLVFHAINQKNQTEIRDLKSKLIALSINKSPPLASDEKIHPEIEHLCFKVPNYQLTEMLTEWKSEVQHSTEIEESLNKILRHLSPNRE